MKLVKNEFSQESLSDIIERTMATLRDSIPDETLARFDEATKALIKTGIGYKCLNIGDKIPIFTLNNIDNISVNIVDILARGPVVISMFRGTWCTFCSIEMRAMQRMLPDVRKLGGEIIAISPQVKTKQPAVSGECNLDFEILVDKGNKVSRKFGLTYNIPSDLRSIYLESFGIDIPSYNGDDSFELPITATYVVSADGVIRYAFTDPDHRKRAEPSEILKALSSMRSNYDMTNNN